MKTLKRIGIAAAVAVIFLGWGYLPEAHAAEFTVTRTDDPSPNACTPDACSLREAVITANNRGGRDTILLSGRVYSLTIPVPPNGDFGFAQVGDLDIYDDVTVEGNGATVNANEATIHDRAFEIHGAGTDVSMSRLSVMNGQAQKTDDTNGDGIPDFARGGGIRVNRGASLHLDRVTLQRNTARSLGQGGAIFNAGDLSLTGGLISLNKSTDGFYGGLGAFGITLVDRAARSTPTRQAWEAESTREALTRLRL